MSMLNQGAANLSDEEQFQTNKSDDTNTQFSNTYTHRYMY